MVFTHVYDFRVFGREYRVIREYEETYIFSDQNI